MLGNAGLVAGFREAAPGATGGPGCFERASSQTRDAGPDWRKSRDSAIRNHDVLTPG